MGDLYIMKMVFDDEMAHAIPLMYTAYDTTKSCTNCGHKTTLLFSLAGVMPRCLLCTADILQIVKEKVEHERHD